MNLERGLIVDIWGDEPPLLPLNPPDGWGREEIEDPVDNSKAQSFLDFYLSQLPTTSDLRSKEQKK